MVKGKSTQPDLEKTLFSLKPGGISKPLPLTAPAGAATGAGKEEKRPEWWLVLKVEKHIPPHEITLEGNADVIEEWMMNDPRFQTQLQEFFGNLRARADVDIVSPRYRMLQEAYQRGREARERQLKATQTAPAAPGVVEAPAAPARGEKERPRAAPPARGK